MITGIILLLLGTSVIAGIDVKNEDIKQQPQLTREYLEDIDIPLEETMDSEGVSSASWWRPDGDWNYWSNWPNMYSRPSGNVGIGTTTPATKLDVVGTVQMTGFQMPTGATSGYVLTSDASGIGTWQAVPGGGIGGSGTTNYIPLFSGATTLTDSSMYESSGNIGIGTTIPSTALDVAGNISVNGAEVINGTGCWVGDPSGLEGPQGPQGPQGPPGPSSLQAAYDGGNTINMVPQRDIWIYDSMQQPLLYLNESMGHVGIGNEMPEERLDVSGNMRINSTDPMLRFSENGPDGAQITHVGPFDQGYLHLWAWEPSLELIGLTISSPDLNVGIGIPYASAKLEVAGLTRTNGLDCIGQARMDSFKMPTNPGYGKVLTSDANGVGTWQSLPSKNTLDKAYDQGGPGQGRQIIADAGAVNITGPDGLDVERNIDIMASDLEFSGNLFLYDNANDVYVTGKYAYVVTEHALNIIDVSDPQHPILINTENVNDGRAVYVCGRYAYVVGDDFQVFDVSNPTQIPHEITMFPNVHGWDIYVSGKFAYVVGDDMLWVFDISDPYADTGDLLVGVFDNLDDARGIYVSGRYAYVAGQQLFILDISDPHQPEMWGHEHTGADTAWDVYVAGMYAYVAVDRAGLVIYDVSDPGQPIHISSTEDDEIHARGVYSGSKYTYLAYWREEPEFESAVAIYDVVDPFTPVLKGKETTFDHAFGVFLSGKYAYVPDDDMGLTILEAPGIDTPTMQAGNIETNDVTVTENADIGNDAYVHGGLTVGERLYVSDEAGFDGKVVFHGDPGPAEPMEYGKQVIWWPYLAAFRAGRASDDEWDEDVTGKYSFASGYNTVAAGEASTAFGSQTAAGGEASTAGGYDTVAAGDYSTAFGHSIDVTGDYSFGVGLDNTGYTVQNDHVFSIMGGNLGVGTTTPNDKLEVAGGIRIDDFIRARDNGGLALKTDEGTTRLFIKDDGKVSVATTTPSAQFEVGDGAVLLKGINGGTPTSGAGRRLMWIPAKGAFRVGQVTSVKWDDPFIGMNSIAMGYNTEASGLGSTALGYETTASGIISTAMGYKTIASGEYTTALGYKAKALGYSSTAIGNITVTGPGSVGINLGGTGAVISSTSIFSVLNGRVGIDTPSPSEVLDVDGKVRVRDFYTSGATYDVQVKSTGELVRVTSSKRYKTDIHDLEVNPLDVLTLQARRFTWKETGEKDIGLIAEEVDKVLKDLVVYDEQGRPDGVSYDKISLYLLEVIKKQNEEIKSQQEQINQLQQDIEEIQEALQIQ